MSSTAPCPAASEGETMPHVIVKLWPGKPERQKARLADAIVKDVTHLLGYGEDSVSVAFEEVSSKDWAEKVYKPDILCNPDKPLQEAGIRPPRASLTVSS